MGVEEVVEAGALQSAAEERTVRASATTQSYSDCSVKMPPSFRARRITPPAAPKAITVNRKPQKAAHGLVDKHTGENGRGRV